MNLSFGISDTALEGVKMITPFYSEDNRGYFLKNMERGVFQKFGIDADIYEEFETCSKKNVIRGLHFQSKAPQSKLVRVIRGRIDDVAVDLRKDSKDFGRWIKVELSDRNHLGLLVPAGFAHGFRVISEEAVVAYQCFGRYLKEFDTGIRWDDKELNIDWGIKKPIVSERDNKLQSFSEFCKCLTNSKEGHDCWYESFNGK